MDKRRAEQAAEALRITAGDLLKIGIVDEIVPEPEGGAHLDHEAAARLLEPVLANSLDELLVLPAAELVERRYEKFRRLGRVLASANA
jgi:acetyl-CoA carboxylase carboxyl transferase subunit alpha